MVTSPPMPQEEIATFLKASPVFAGLPPKVVETLAALAREEACRPLDYVFAEGEAALWFCLVKSGRVKLVKQSRAGKEVVLEVLGPGEVVGGVAALEKRPHPAGAQAVELSVIVKIPAEAMVALTERFPSVIKELALMIGRRLRAAHDSVKSLAVDPVEARLAATLLRLAEREGTRARQGLTLPFHLTRQSLADMTGTTVETTIRIVSRWLEEGLLLEEGGRLVLKDVEGLRARVGGDVE